MGRSTERRKSYAWEVEEWESGKMFKRASWRRKTRKTGAKVDATNRNGSDPVYLSNIVTRRCVGLVTKKHLFVVNMNSIMKSRF